MVFKAVVKDVPLWESKKFKGTVKCDLLFSKEMAWYTGKEFEFEPVSEFKEDGYVIIPDWFKTTVNNASKQLDFYFFHESWLERS